MNPKAKLRAALPDYIGNLRNLTTSHAPDAVTAREGYTITNKGDTATIRIYDEIWWLGVNAEDLAADLDGISASSITVQINSPGGDVFDGVAIYNALRNHPAKVTTQVDGIAASIASVIFQAGDRRLIQASGQVMIHNAFGGIVGDRTDHADMAALLEQQDEIISGIYAAASGRDAAEFRALMDAETWMTAQRAIDEGLADEIIDPNNESPRAQLHDEIMNAVSVVADALEAAESVDAVRADAGKTLSERNRECLVGLRDDVTTRVNALLETGQEDETSPEPEPDKPGELDEDAVQVLHEAALRQAAAHLSGKDN